MRRCPTEDLEAYARGALGSSEEASRIAAHIERCPSCAEEMAWLAAEKRLFEARAAELPEPPALRDVLARARGPERVYVPRAPRSRRKARRREAPRASRWRAAVPLILTAFAAAAGLLFYLSAGPDAPLAAEPEPLAAPPAAYAEPPLPAESPAEVPTCTDSVSGETGEGCSEGCPESSMKESVSPPVSDDSASTSSGDIP